MLETITLITLTLILLTILRPGTTPPLERPLTINRIGQFQAVLAPKINLAQPLLEGISQHLAEQDRQNGNSATLYLAVQDKAVTAHGKDFYLLATTLRDGMLYFQACAPDDKGNNLETLRAFSEAELAHHPETGTHSSAAEPALLAAIHAAANQRGITISQLGE